MGGANRRNGGRCAILISLLTGPKDESWQALSSSSSHQQALTSSHSRVAACRIPAHSAFRSAWYVGSGTPDNRFVGFGWAVMSSAAARQRLLCQLCRAVRLGHGAHDVGQLWDRATGELAEQRAAVIRDFKRPGADQVLMHCASSGVSITQISSALTTHRCFQETRRQRTFAALTPACSSESLACECPVPGAPCRLQASTL